jgi:hypothetical protein
MQQVERRDVTKNGFSPVKGLLIVAALAVAGAAFLLLTSNDPEPTTPNTTDAPTTLTDEQAISTFHTLADQAFAAVLHRDASALGQAFVPGSSAYRRAETVIDGLISDGVIDKTRIDIQTVEVVTNSATEITLRSTARIRPCFITEKGRDVTTGPKLVERVSDWSLRSHQSVWLIEAGTVVKEVALLEKDAFC